MHRTIEITLAPNGMERLLAMPVDNEPVMDRSVQQGTSIKPPGDVVLVHTLNQGADAV